MKLYHYSKERFPVLLSKRAAGASHADIKASEEKVKKLGLEGAYVDHISFFFDPIPSSTVARLFGKDHDFWFPGNRVFEYVVDVDSLDSEVLYRVVESFKKTEFMDKFAIDNDWTTDDPEILKRYLKEIDVLQRSWGELGTTLSGLKKQVASFSGKTKEAYVAASRREDFEDGKMRYASNVPHLMLYPKTGRVDIEAVYRLTIGSDVRSNPLPPSIGW